MLIETKLHLDFVEIAQRIDAFSFSDVDHVVGIASGGTTVASLVAYKLKKPLSILAINYRNEHNRPRFDKPQMLSQFETKLSDERVLLVDDVSVSGQTLSLAKQSLGGNTISTFVLKGIADFVLFPELEACVQWPWKSA